jgi:hypothetical protein
VAVWISVVIVAAVSRYACVLARDLVGRWVVLGRDLWLGSYSVICRVVRGQIISCVLVLYVHVMVEVAAGGGAVPGYVANEAGDYDREGSRFIAGVVVAMWMRATVPSCCADCSGIVTLLAAGAVCC